MYFESGSARPIFPSSTSIITATLVKAFVCEAIRKIVSFFIGTPASMSALPNASWWATRPLRAT